MNEAQQEHEPAYTSRIAPLNQFIILFCIGIGFVGLIMFIPMLLLFGYLVIEGSHVGLYVFGLTALPFLIGGGIYGAKLLYREMKRRIINNKYPSGYDLHDKQLSFRRFDTNKNHYIYGNIPYSEILKVVISIHPEPILGSAGLGKIRLEGFEYFPVSHIVYMEDGAYDYYSNILMDKAITENLLTTMKQHHVPMEVTRYNLGPIPEEMFVRVVTEDLTLETLHHPNEISTYIKRGHQYQEAPEVYMDADTEWLMRERGVTGRMVKPWHTILLFILLSVFSAVGFVMTEPGFFAIVVIPYMVLSVSYIAFIYSLKKVRYWKTIPYMVITLVIYIGILFMTGNNPFIFEKEAGAMATFQNHTSEAVIGTVIGFYGGSVILYIFTRDMIRIKWPAHFHERIANALERKKEF